MFLVFYFSYMFLILIFVELYYNLHAFQVRRIDSILVKEKDILYKSIVISIILYLVF